MCLSFHIKVVHLFGMLKKKSIHAKYLCLLPQDIFYPGLPNLGSQIRIGITAVQIDLKYPLTSNI